MCVDNILGVHNKAKMYCVLSFAPVVYYCHQITFCLFVCLQSWIREHFVCVDQDRLLYHFLVEGTVIKDGSKVQCDVSVALF